MTGQERRGPLEATPQASHKEFWPGAMVAPGQKSLSEFQAAICLETGTTLISSLRGRAATVTGAVISSMPF